MPTYQGKPFLLQQCWKVLQHSEKWRLRDQEAPSKKSALVPLDDDEDSDAPKGGGNKAIPDERKMEKDNEEESRGRKLEGEH